LTCGSSTFTTGVNLDFCVLVSVKIANVPAFITLNQAWFHVIVGAQFAQRF
jgi:hypothetical protein